MTEQRPEPVMIESAPCPKCRGATTINEPTGSIGTDGQSTTTSRRCAECGGEGYVFVASPKRWSAPRARAIGGTDPYIDENDV